MGYFFIIYFYKKKFFLIKEIPKFIFKIKINNKFMNDSIKKYAHKMFCYKISQL